METHDDIVFENRLKDYGAYRLRKGYQSTVWRAFGIGLASLIFIVLAPYVSAKVFKKDIMVDYGGVVIDFIPPPNTEKPIEKPIEPPKVLKAESIKTKALLPPEPLPDIEVEKETLTPTDEDLSVAKISNVNQAGKTINEMITEVPERPSKEPSKTTAEVEVPENELFITVEQQAEYVGGYKALLEYLSNNIKYPMAASRAEVSGKIFLQFVVNKDGSITDIEVLRSLGFGCDEEAVRVVKSMPNWKPGRQNGNAVRSRFTLPINFKLD